MQAGKLYLIPTPLSEELKTIPEQVKEVVYSLTEFIVEDEKNARHFLKKIGIKVPLNTIVLHLLNEHTKQMDIPSLLKPLKEGRTIGLLSDAGCPAVADPGAELVKMAHEEGIEVIPLTGPSSIILALMASGMNGQSFTFHGYLPRERTARVRKIKELEQMAMSKNQTQIFIEAPYRNHHVLEDLLSTCYGATRLCIACDISSTREFIKTRSVSAWKGHLPSVEKRPTVFIIGK